MDDHVLDMFVRFCDEGLLQTWESYLDWLLPTSRKQQLEIHLCLLISFYGRPFLNMFVRFCDEACCYTIDSLICAWGGEKQMEVIIESEPENMVKTNLCPYHFWESFPRDSGNHFPKGLGIASLTLWVTMPRGCGNCRFRLRIRLRESIPRPNSQMVWELIPRGFGNWFLKLSDGRGSATARTSIWTHILSSSSPKLPLHLFMVKLYRATSIFSAAQAELQISIL